MQRRMPVRSGARANHAHRPAHEWRTPCQERTAFRRDADHVWLGGDCLDQWLTRLTVTDEPFVGPFQGDLYVVYDADGTPIQPVREMPVKSIIVYRTKTPPSRQCRSRPDSPGRDMAESLAWTPAWTKVKAGSPLKSSRKRDRSPGYVGNSGWSSIWGAMKSSLERPTGAAYSNPGNPSGTKRAIS